MIKQKKGEIKKLFLMLISLLFVVIESAGLVSAVTCGTGITEGMVSYWTFDDTDLSGSDPLDIFGDNDGTNVGATTGVSGQVGEAFSFDGENDYINCGSDSSIDNILVKTISFWTRLNSYDGNDEKGSHWINKGDKWFIATYDNNNIHIFGQNFDSNNGRWSIPLSSIGLNSWHHIIIVYDKSSTSNNPVWYVDGVSQTVTEYATPIGSAVSDASDNMYIGDSPEYDRGLNGTIDEVAIFNRSLSAEEISDLYDKGVAGKGYCEEIGFGNLTTYWVTPVTDTNVQQNEFFKVQIGVNCTGGKCGDVNVTLDPKEVQKAIEDYKAQQNIITGEVVEEVKDEMNFFEKIIDFIKGVFGG